MDKLDQLILRELQDDFPLSERPYEVIADRLQISCEKLWDRVKWMLDEGVIRRLGASFDSNKLGFSSTLAAVSVGPECVDRAAKIIGEFAEVTHSYLRSPRTSSVQGKDVFNIWFTIIASDDKRIENILEQIRTSLSLESSQVLNLPVKRLFKLAAPSPQLPPLREGHSRFGGVPWSVGDPPHMGTGLDARLTVKNAKTSEKKLKF